MCVLVVLWQLWVHVHRDQALFTLSFNLLDAFIGLLAKLTAWMGQQLVKHTAITLNYWGHDNGPCTSVTIGDTCWGQCFDKSDDSALHLCVMTMDDGIRCQVYLVYIYSMLVKCIFFACDDIRRLSRCACGFGRLTCTLEFSEQSNRNDKGECYIKSFHHRLGIIYIFSRFLYTFKIIFIVRLHSLYCRFLCSNSRVHNWKRLELI